MEKLNSFYKMLKDNAEKYPDKEAIVYDTMTITYSKLFEDVCRKALHLMRFEGSRIALYGPASYRWIVNMFGTIPYTRPSTSSFSASGIIIASLFARIYWFVDVST